MHKSPHDATVFVSSTSQDLEDYRAVARNVILDMHWQPVMSEYFGAQSGTTVETCRREIEKCDLVLLIVAWRQGWVPTAEQGGNGLDSITALELGHARSHGIPTLVLVASDSWPGNLWDRDPAKLTWVENFRNGLNQVFESFEHEAAVSREKERLPAFRATVKKVLLAYKEKQLASAETSAPSLAFFQSVRDGLLEGNDIPVLGCGLFGNGPLGSEALVRALLKQRGGSPDSLLDANLPLATAAEYRERFDGSRQQFLDRFRSILQRQSSEAAIPPVLRLLSGLESVSLIVSATYDCVLEEQLELTGRKYVVVAHVLRSADGELDKSIVVKRPGEPAAFCRADELRLLPNECAVYKPQGSPLLHDALDPDLEIDTVVVTETDHAVFLQRLESPETGVPPPIKKRFRRCPLLFLGYAMDVWQYRLMMLVFQSARRNEGSASTRAVRIPDNEVEEVAWNRLNASVIRMDPNEFARSALATGGAAS